MPTKRRPDAAVAHAAAAGRRQEVPRRAAASALTRPGSRRSAPAARPSPAAIAPKTAVRERLARARLRATCGVARSGRSGSGAGHGGYLFRIPRTTRSAVRLTTKVISEQQDADDEQHAVVVEPADASPSSAAMVAVSVRTGSNSCAGCGPRGPSPSARPSSRRRRGRRPAAPPPAGRCARRAAARGRRVCQRVAPSASAASRYESGTALSASSPMQTMIGTLISARMSRRSARSGRRARRWSR